MLTATNFPCPTRGLVGRRGRMNSEGGGRAGVQVAVVTPLKFPMSQKSRCSWRSSGESLVARLRRQRSALEDCFTIATGGLLEAT